MPQDPVHSPDTEEPQEAPPIREYHLEGSPLNERLRVSIRTGDARSDLKIDLLQIDEGKFVVVAHRDNKLGVVLDITPVLRVGQMVSLRWDLLGKIDQSTMTAGTITGMELVRPADTSNMTLVSAARQASKARWYLPVS